MTDKAVAIPRVGGQALGDGVFMRTGRAWAIARVDGTIEVGEFPSSRLSAVPVVRVLASLIPGLALGLRALLSRGNGGRLSKVAPMLLVITGVSLVVPALLAGWRTTLAGNAAVDLVLTGVLLVLLRLLTPGSLWRFHGAEHKAVTAHEDGVDLDDTDAVLACSRIHGRCGTNLVAVMALAGVALSRLPLAPQLVAFLLALAIVAELLGVAVQRPRALPSRLLLGGGKFLQRHLTTAEPTAAEQRIGCLALQACLAEHDRLVALDAGEQLAVAA